MSGAPVVIRGVKVTNPDRVVYRIRDQAVTKGDVARFIEAVAPMMLPHVRGRPISIVRCRAGSDGPGFFQKHAMQGQPAPIDSIDVLEKKGVHPSLAVHDAAGLVGLVQMSALEFHVWSSKENDTETPDRIIIDLDPDPGLPWERVVAAAELARDVLADDCLDSFVKTTGGKGLHVIAPLDVSDPAKSASWEQASAYGARVAAAMLERSPEHYTTNMKKALRTGKIFIDFLRNSRGATTVAPWSPRKNGGTISVPVEWEELPEIRGNTWTLIDLDERLRTRDGDPWAHYFDVRQRLPKEED